MKLKNIGTICVLVIIGLVFAFVIIMIAYMGAIGVKHDIEPSPVITDVSDTTTLSLPSLSSVIEVVYQQPLGSYRIIKVTGSDVLYIIYTNGGITPLLHEDGSLMTYDEFINPR